MYTTRVNVDVLFLLHFELNSSVVFLAGRALCSTVLLSDKKGRWQGEQRSKQCRIGNSRKEQNREDLSSVEILY